ncbi:MAG: hypothetical protein RLN62_03990 [Rickettsiales bacterium]
MSQKVEGSKNRKIDLADNIVHDEIDNIIQEICSTHDTEDIQKDIIALFEDIIKFFTGREAEFRRLKDLPPKEQEEIYEEIKALINMLRSMGNEVDRAEILSIMSKRLIEKFSGKSKNKSLNKEAAHIQDEKIKEVFAKMAFYQLRKQQRKQINREIRNKEIAIEKVKESIQDFISKESPSPNFSSKEAAAKLQKSSKKRFIG